MFKHKIVRQLACLLAIKLIIIFTIKATYFEKPVLQEQDQAYKEISQHFFNHEVVSKNNKTSVGDK